MDHAAQSKSEADSQIEERRRDNGINDKQQQSSGLISSLNASLEIISDQLYQNPSHFLLELIQNADDNRFPHGAIPSLTISMYSRSTIQYLRSDCNEVGFTYANLHAITLVGQSSKRGADGGKKGYIGEKGIGFKSVFKVADIVHIASGHYEFMFDRTGPLGMILPHHRDFPSKERRRGHTQFLLTIRDEEEWERIQHDLQEIEPQILLFLRNLRRLEIQTGISTTEYVLRFDEYDTKYLGETRTIELRDGEHDQYEEMQYLVVRHNEKEMPAERRRHGVTMTEVMLAFPIQDSQTPVTTRQKVFAFMPIDDFGFKFLIHADFLLVASREAVEYNLPWNIALRDALRHAFSKAIARFTTIPAADSASALRYTWPKYLKHHISAHDFWNWLHDDMIRDLRTQRILESCNPSSRYYRASDLRFVPKKFRFEESALFDCPSLQKQHLSFGYDSVHEELRVLGVRTLSLHDMGKELATWIQEKGVAELSRKPEAWHEQIAALFYNETQLRDHLKELPIVPLEDGSWVSARTQRLYIASENGNDHVPHGISMSLIDGTASRNPSRRRFFQSLGVLPYTAKHVCELIGELHSGTVSTIRTRDVEDLVADAAYLFKHRMHFLEGPRPRIYFLVERTASLSHRKDQIYIATESPCSRLVTKYRNEPRSPFFFLDQRYERKICNRDPQATERFRQWLKQSQGVSIAPVLVRDSYLTPEWQFLRETDMVDLLLVVKEQWRSQSIDDRLLQDVPQLQVECRDGELRTLAEVAIPTNELLRACPHLAFAALPDLDSWAFLSHFGITTAPTTATWLHELDELSKLPLDSVYTDAVHECYRGLSWQDGLNEEKKRIVQAFNSKPLIFIARPYPKWVSYNSCVWKAPELLTRVTRLSNRYNDCRRLFVEYLGVKSASIEHVVDEVCSMQEQHESEGYVRRFEELLATLRSYLKDKSAFTTNQFLRLRYARVFPVIAATGPHDIPEPRTVYRAIHDGDWYVPDRLTLETAFRGRINLLDLPVKAVESHLPVLSILDCQHLYLLTIVRETIEPRGSKVREIEKEKDLNIRLRYISCLGIPSSGRHPGGIQSLRAWSVPSVVVTRCLGDLKIEEDNALVTFHQDPQTINLYFRVGIPPMKYAQVNFKLMDFFSQLYSVKVEDKSIVTLLLSAAVEDLSSIMAANNLFGPEEEPVESAPSPFAAVVQDIVSETSSASSILSVDVLRSLRDFVRSRSPSITNSALRYRIAKASVAGGAAHARTRSERHQQSLDIISRASTTNIPFTLAQDNLSNPHAANFAFPDNPPETAPVSTSEATTTRQIGYSGERWIYEIFKKSIPDWSFENWTSKLRELDGHPRFRELEKNFTDFTYADHSGAMKSLLQQAGLDPSTEWANGAKCHLEVKTTVGSCGEPFSVSQNQLMKMRRYDNDPGNIYILLRVFNIDDEDNQGLKIYPRPWGLWAQGVLNFTAAGSYQVTEGKNALLSDRTA